jgi:hypothetical protein
MGFRAGRHQAGKIYFILADVFGKIIERVDCTKNFDRLKVRGIACRCLFLSGAGTLVLNPLGNLTTDEIDAGKDYLTVMRENLVNLQKALEVAES